MIRQSAMHLSLSWLLFAPGALGACWQVAPNQSQLVFIASQAGGTLQGHFNNYSGIICTHADSGALSPIRATVDLASVESGLPELDEALRGGDFFDVERWPKALFVGAVGAPLGDDRYEVTGSLQLRDVSREITAPVILETDAEGLHAKLSTRLTLARLSYGIGQGEWADTQWVGDEVTVELTATLAPVPDPSNSKVKAR
jgi:polyisoprenoid-binding protein YceI